MANAASLFYRGLHIIRCGLAIGFVACVVFVVVAGDGCSSDGCKGEPRSQVAGSSDAALAARLRASLIAKGPSYRPRTRHLNPDGSPQHTNRLILESSPYLLQHAHNPVDWFAWGEEAFARARALHRPIFLSIGYSTCHWCHVMEEESFEDEAIAAYLNEHYVAIKVDREERPDIDAAYMGFVQAFTGGGGWPANLWLTGAREVFFAGTYFPPRQGVRGAEHGLLEILRAQAERYAANPAAVATEAGGLATRMRTAAATAHPSGQLPDAGSLMQRARADAERRYDRIAGGARGAPKFPSSFPVGLLLRIARRAGDGEAREMATTTLSRMRAGGIYDQLGGGFHRYATDARWRVPHFEKTLYDNALLALRYLEASQAADDPDLRATTREILDFLLRDMAGPEGTFYAATDADSLTPDGQRQEGAYFTWTIDDLREALAPAGAELAARWFGVSKEGDLDGRSVLHLSHSLAELAGELRIPAATLETDLVALRTRLLQQRARRPGPARDDKVLVAWNALAISALARAALVLGEPRYADAARRAARALLAPVHAGSPLPHWFMRGRALGRGFSDDFIMLAAALLDLFELTADPSMLGDAIALMEEAERSFSDAEAGGYFLDGQTRDQLPLREKADFDGPIPSVNSVAALTWLRLSAFTDSDEFARRADRTLRSAAATLSEQPLSVEHMLFALDWATDDAKQIVIAVPSGSGALAPSARALLSVLARSFVPNAVWLIASDAELDGALGDRVPWAKEKRVRSGQATAYVCEHHTCALPTSDPRVFAGQLATARPYH